MLITFPNNHSFGMGLSTRASRLGLLHKSRENDTICVLQLDLLRLLFSIIDPELLAPSWGSRSRTATLVSS